MMMPIIVIIVIDILFISTAFFAFIDYSMTGKGAALDAAMIFSWLSIITTPIIILEHINIKREEVQHERFIK
jgi:hypothetical protein